MTYNEEDKELCWYKDICDKSKCDDFCIRHYKMSCLVESALIEGKQKYPVKLFPVNDDLEAFKKLKSIQKNIKQFVEDGKNLLIYSKNTGNGKTAFSTKILLSYFDSIWSSTDFECRGMFISMPRFIQAMKENISSPNEYYTYVNENILKADLIVWDEINYKDWSSYEQDYMLGVLSQRIAVGKSNIYTTNYELDEIEKKLGSRLASRVIGCSELVKLVGPDMRGANR